MEEFFLLLAKLDIEQRKMILEYIKSLLNDYPSCRSLFLFMMAFASDLFQ